MMSSVGWSATPVDQAPEVVVDLLPAGVDDAQPHLGVARRLGIDPLRVVDAVSHLEEDRELVLG